MEWAVWATSSDSEDATTEIDEEDGAPSNTDQQCSLLEVAAESSTNDTQGAIGLTFINKSASTRNGWGFRDSVKAEYGEKASHKDIQDLIHFGKKDRNNAPVPIVLHSTLAVNVSEEDESEDLTMQTMSGDEEQELVTKKDLGEPPEEFELHNSTADFGIIWKQNARRSEVQTKKRHFTEDGKDEGSKLAKISMQPQKNQMPSESTEYGKSPSDPSRCQWSESFQARHLEENFAAEPVTCTENTELFCPPKEVHTGEAKYNCPECNKTCNNSLQLNQHRIIAHHIGKAFMCPECNNHFATADGMSEHRLLLHKVEQPYQCSNCNTAFNSSLLRNKHWKEHHILERLNCPDCKKGFSNPESLLEHQVMTHNAEKPFQCTECNLKFITLPRLNKHFLSHLKPYNCPKCNSAFDSSLVLDSHLHTAHGLENSFKCSDCSERFSELDCMKRHRLLIHNAKEHFPCAHCMITFNSLEQLMKHQVACSGGAPYQCTECNILFRTPTQLRVHLLQVHKVETQSRGADYTTAFAVVDTLDFPWEVKQ